MKCPFVVRVPGVGSTAGPSLYLAYTLNYLNLEVNTFSCYLAQQHNRAREDIRLEELRHIREQAGYSQQDLADESGVSQHTISELELGRRSPQGRTLRKLAKVLGVEVADLRGDPDSPKAEAPPWQQPPLNGLLAEERRSPTFAELHAINTLKGHRDHLEEFLARAKRKDIAPVFWVIEADHTIDMAAVGLAFLEREHLRPVLLPTAARLVELANEVFDGLRDAEAEEEVKRRRAALRMLEEAVA